MVVNSILLYDNLKYDLLLNQLTGIKNELAELNNNIKDNRKIKVMKKKYPWPGYDGTVQGTYDGWCNDPG